MVVILIIIFRRKYEKIIAIIATLALSISLMSCAKELPTKEALIKSVENSIAYKSSTSKIYGSVNLNLPVELMSSPVECMLQWQMAHHLK